MHARDPLSLAFPVHRDPGARWPARVRAAVAAVAAVASIVLALAGQAVAAAIPDIPDIAAAADLQFALPEIAAAFTRDTGREVRLSFGSSGNFRRQIDNGAPFQIFLSADQAYVDALSQEGRTLGAGDLYAVGRLALVVPQGSPLEPDPELRDLKRALADGRLRKFAIANPEHAPYGRAARQALTRAGLWAAIVPKLVLGENISQAAQFAVSDATQGGIVAYSLALSPRLAAHARYVLLPASMHDPLLQRMVLLKNAGDTARRFYAYLQGPAARAILDRYGFRLPDGSPDGLPVAPR